MLKNKKKNAKPKEKIKSAPKFYMVIEGEKGLSCRLDGAIGVREVTKERVGILLRNGSVSVEGKCLNITVYDNNCLEILGNIDNISVAYKTKRGVLLYED